jgi:hypothetical protein
MKSNSVVIDLLAKEMEDLAFQEAIGETERWAKSVKMTDQQKREYALYRKACRFAGVGPTRADFLAGDIPSCVTREMEWLQSPLSKMTLDGVVILQATKGLKAMGKAAGAGR